MNELIEAALDEADKDDNGYALDNGIDPDWAQDPNTVRGRLRWCLFKTGPLYHNGTVYIAGEGEEFNVSIIVFNGVRFSHEVKIPDLL